MTEHPFTGKVDALIAHHADVRANLDRKSLIKDSVEYGEAYPSASGALATWTPPESTGRSPKDTYVVRHEATADTIDWDSPNNIPLDPSTFDMLVEDAIETLSGKDRLYVTERSVGADVAYALPVKTVAGWALTALFTDNMFRAIPSDISKSVFADRPFTVLVCPYEKLDPARYEDRLRKLPGGQTSDMAVAMDLDRDTVVVFGSAYGGSVKKSVFTVMNYILPAEGILPLHCSANEGPEGDCALLLGLSGTGKTTLSADPSRALLGDDEHGWSDAGIANFENGCYAKLINLSAEKEPEISNAIFHKDDYVKHGAIIENAMMYPDGSFDLDDERLTPNSRASYPLVYLRNIKPASTSGHPRTILFLSADANGVLPPIAKLAPDQAMLWFLMGYTSKLAGTETGITDPVSSFSRFFAEPFMPRNPGVYASMLGEKMQEYGSQVFLVNTGWSGGPYGVGSRMDITLTRAIVDAALSGKLDDVEYVEDKTFHIWVPKEVPGVASNVLMPRNTWADKNAYDVRARKLAQDFADHFEAAYGDKDIAPNVAAQCPGR